MAATVAAILQEDVWLFLHVFGAMALVGSLIVALYAIRIARQRGDQPAAQFAFRALLRGTLPAYLVMRIAAQVVESQREGIDDEAAWIGIGYMTTEGGLLLLIIALILTGRMARRTKQGESAAGRPQLRVAGGIAGVLIAAYIVAIWAMTTKPT